MTKITIFLFSLILLANSVAQDVDAYVELIRSDIRAKKIVIIKETMNFSDEQASVFWPIYREYNNELEKVSDERLQLIKSYLKFYENMTDETAKVLAEKSVEIDQKFLDLRKVYFKKFEKALSAKLAAKLMQVDNQINSLIRLQVDSELPLIE